MASRADTSGNYGKALRGGPDMTEGSRAQRLILRGGMASVGGLAVRLGARLLFLVIAARLFGAASLGAYSIAVAVVELAVAVGGLGMKRYLFKLFEERGARAPGHVLLDAVLLVLPASVMLSVGIALITMVLPAGTIAEQTAFGLLCTAPLVAGQALIDLCLATTRWRQQMHYEVVGRSIIEPYVAVGAMIATYFAGFAATGLVIGYAAGTLAALAYAAFGAWRCLERIDPGAYRPAPAKLARTLRASAMPTLTDALAALFTRADLYFVGAMLGEAAAGIYALARQLKLPIRQVRQAFDSMLTPIVAKTLHSDGAQATGSAIASATRLILVLQLGLVLTLVAIGQPMLAWFGPEFAPAYVALLLLAAAETIQGAFSVSDLLLLYLRARLALAVTSAMMLAYAVIAVPLIALHGLDGAALAMLIAIQVGALVRRWLLRTRFAVTTPWLHSAGAWLAAAVAAIAAGIGHRAIPVDAAPPYHLGALAAVLLIYWAALSIWQRVTGETLQLTGFRAA